MTTRLDWKFLIVLAATVAGVAAPVWLWRADLTSRALHFKLISTISLQPKGPAALDGLTLTLDEVKLESPHLTLVELHNDGSRPIPSTDYEGPIELRIAPPTSILRVRAVKANPETLPVQAKIAGTAVQIQPLLLNPGDSVTFAILTTGSEPTFTSMARIAGVRTLPILAEVNQAPKVAVAALAFIFAFASLIPAGTVLWAGSLNHVVLRKKTILITILVGLGFGLLLTLSALRELGLDSFWPYAGTSTLLITLATVLGTWLNEEHTIDDHSHKGSAA